MWPWVNIITTNMGKAYSVHFGNGHWGTRVLTHSTCVQVLSTSSRSLSLTMLAIGQESAVRKSSPECPGLAGSCTPARKCHIQLGIPLCHKTHWGPRTTKSLDFPPPRCWNDCSCAWASRRCEGRYIAPVQIRFPSFPWCHPTTVISNAGCCVEWAKLLSPTHVACLLEQHKPMQHSSKPSSPSIWHQSRII